MSFHRNGSGLETDVSPINPFLLPPHPEGEDSLNFRVLGTADYALDVVTLSDASVSHLPREGEPRRPHLPRLTSRGCPTTRLSSLETACQEGAPRVPFPFLLVFLSTMRSEGSGGLPSCTPNPLKVSVSVSSQLQPIMTLSHSVPWSQGLWAARLHPSIPP